jgi:Flp pilus assembly protein TadD
VDPENAVAANNLAVIYGDDEQKRGEALRLARLAAEKAPDNAFTLDTLGWIQFRTMDYPGAVRTLERAHELMPEHPEIAYHLGMAYEKVKRPDDARRLLRMALDAPQKGDWAADAGQALQRLEKKAR